MNFLLRSATTTHQPVAEPPGHPEPPAEPPKAAPTLEGLIAEESFPQYPSGEGQDHVAVGSGGDSGSGGLSAKNGGSLMERFSDVSEEEGWITIPYKEIPDNWSEAADIHSLRSLDRSFVFSGEQVHILACLSASKGETEIITPFKVAEVMSRTSHRKLPDKPNGHLSNGASSPSRDREMSPDGQFEAQNGESSEKEHLGAQKNVADGESILRMEDHKRKTKELLQRFQNSHFFVRIAESGEPLWSKKGFPTKDPETDETRKSGSAFIDRGDFYPDIAGGVARNITKCSALPNGDIVVLLQVNIMDSPKNPVIEILQFEKHQDRTEPPEDHNNLDHEHKDPCGDLLKWLIPLESTFPLPSRSLSPPLSSSPGISNTSHRSAFSANSGSQLFSFGHFRSYSMSSLPPNTSSPGPSKPQSSKSSFEIEEWDNYSSQKLSKGQKFGNEKLLSFRGVSLERDRFSVRCGLEGICIPGRRWRRKLEIIQPIEIHSSAADCNTDDLLCVQIKNVVPAHTPDIVIYVDAITIVFEEAGKGGTLSSLPIASIEAGNDHNLPNLALRKGEEHSFIVKPSSSVGNNVKAFGERRLRSSSLRLPSMNFDRKGTGLNADEYAVMVSCRCNYTESRLFFKQRTNWRPRVSRDLMISVASEISGQACAPHGQAAQLPVQVLSLQASNLTSEDLSLTVLAPASFTSPPSVVSLNSKPAFPVSAFRGFSELTERVGQSEKRGSMRKLNSLPPIPLGTRKEKGNDELMSCEQTAVIPKGALGCSHLWLQSRVPLGCIPSQSTAIIKLELLPLTDGIITLDTLQIHVKEKGRRYIPEQSLKINATSSISTGIF